MYLWSSNAKAGGIYPRLYYEIFVHILSLFSLYLLSLFFCQIIFNTIAYETGLKERDFIVEINGTQVFDMNHDVCKDLIKQAGDTIKIKIER